MNRYFIGFLLLLLIFPFYGQDLQYAQKVLKKLTSNSYHGRGYVKNGDHKAAMFIARQFEKYNLQKIDSDYFQNYQLAINTFPGTMEVKVDGDKLKPGKDFVVSSSSQGIVGDYDLVFLEDTITSDAGFYQTISQLSHEDKFIVTTYYSRSLYGKTIENVIGIIVLEEKNPWWHVSNGVKVEETCWLKVNSLKLKKTSKKIYVDIETAFIDSYQTQNVIAFVKGKKTPDRFVAFTAHYDHLGMMGKKTTFPGANDNGSGTAMLMDLARHYAIPDNQPDISMVFMLFSGEEAGLCGSRHYAENPLFKLEKIRFLVNLDMVGTGSEGITVVNGKAYKDVMDSFLTINNQNNYLVDIKARGESCSSDHCPFYEKGVKSIFIYTRGKEHQEYHTIYDDSKSFPFTAYDGLFKLLTSYVENIR